MFTLSQSVAQPHERATASALNVLIITLIGYGVGPPLVGVIADHFTALHLVEIGLRADACVGANQAQACVAASGEGLRMALMSSSVLLIWGGLHFWRAGRTLCAIV
jgi:hypothetical protein